MAHCVKLSGEDLSHYSNKIESVGCKKMYVLSLSYYESDVTITNIYQRLPLPLQNCPFPYGGMFTCIYYVVPWSHPSPQSKRHLDRFSRFCRAHYCNWPTDHATRSVTIGRIYVRSTAMRPIINDEHPQNTYSLLFLDVWSNSVAWLLTCEGDSFRHIFVWHVILSFYRIENLMFNNFCCGI